MIKIIHEPHGATMPGEKKVDTPNKSTVLQLMHGSTTDLLLVILSLTVQMMLGLFFGHLYDMRIFMATGYLVGTGQNPYLAQDLSSVFHNSAFQNITSYGYPPLWTIVLGLIYLCTYQVVPNFLLYNLAIKLPIIAANICLAYLALHILSDLGVQENISRRAWMFLLFNPFMLLTSAAWGQIDTVVALLALLSLWGLWKGKLTIPAILLALAVSIKPIAIPLLPAILIYVAGKSVKGTLRYFIVFTFSIILFCTAPFFLFGWDPSIILKHWNAHFSLGGGLSFMTFLEYTNLTYQLPSQWWFLGWLWVPALAIASYAMRSGITDFADLLKKSLALILVFYLCRAWLSEPNINLILPLALILVSMRELDHRWLTLAWLVPLIFSLFNMALVELLFPSMSGLMDRLTLFAGGFATARFAVRTVIVAVWYIVGAWIIFVCFKKLPAQSGKVMSQDIRLN